MSIGAVLAWGTLGTLAAWRAIRIWRDPRELMAPASLVAFGFLFLYVLAFMALGPSDRSLLSGRGYARVLALAAVGLPLFLVGHGHSDPGSARFFTALDRRRSLGFAAALVFVSLAGWVLFLARSGGFLAFYGSHHGAGGAWADTSAYVYNLRLFLYPALFILLAVRLDGGLTGWPWAATLLLGLGLVADAWWQGSRGGFLRLGIIAGVCGLLWPNSRWRQRRLVLPATVLLLGLVVLLPYVRVAMHLGAETSLLGEAERALGVHNPLAGSTPGEGNELIFAAGLVESAAARDSFDLGKKWLYPLVAFVPRSVWNEKPYAAEWSIDESRLVFKQQGWTVARGAAPTGLADAFVRFGWASPVVWLLLGAWSGALYQRSLKKPDPLVLGHLAAGLVGLLYMVTQGFNAAFYAWFYFVVPLVAWRLIANRQDRVRLPVARRADTG